MNSRIITDYYNPLLKQSSFSPAPCGDRFCAAGSCCASFSMYAYRKLIVTPHSHTHSNSVDLLSHDLVSRSLGR